MPRTDDSSVSKQVDIGRARGTLVRVARFSYDPFVRAVPKLQVAGLATAEKLLPSRVIGPAEINAALGVSLTDILDVEEREQVQQVPFDESTLERAAAHGALLVLRLSRDSVGPLSIRRFYDLFPAFFAKRSMIEGVGYALRNEWTSSAQSFATEAPTLGWRLVCAAPIGETLGKTFFHQQTAIDGWARENGFGKARTRRRAAIDAVYDLVLTWRTFQLRLLEDTWDWTRTQTDDGAYVTVGNFDDQGIQVLAYSPGVKFQSLGTCVEIA